MHVTYSRCLTAVDARILIKDSDMASLSVGSMFDYRGMRYYVRSIGPHGIRCDYYAISKFNHEAHGQAISHGWPNDEAFTRDTTHTINRGV